MPEQFDSRVALVSGAKPGIGRAIALAFVIAHTFPIDAGRLT